MDRQTDRQTETHTQHTHADMKKLTITFHNLLNAPNQIRLMFEFPNTIPEGLKHFGFHTIKF